MMGEAVGILAGYRGQSKGRDSNGSSTDTHPTNKTVQYNITLNTNKLKENMKLTLNR